MEKIRRMAAEKTMEMMNFGQATKTQQENAE